MSNKINDFNNKIALKITDVVATVWCAYLFAIIGIMGVTGALTGNVQLVLVVGAVSGYFLQLVLLPIIMVGGKLQSEKTVRHVKTHLDDHHEKIKQLIKEK